MSVKRPDLVAFNKTRCIPLKESCCLSCGKIFKAQRSAKRKYCSAECYKLSMFGRKNPNAVSAMKKASIGRNAFWNRDEEKIEKQRQKLTGRPNIYAIGKWLGEKNPHWSGGTTKFRHLLRSSRQFIHWRGKCFALHGRKCCVCGCDDKNLLQIDHIKPMAIILKENGIKNLNQAFKCEELWDMNNTRVLCIECHSKTETYMSKYFDWRKRYETK